MIMIKNRIVYTNKALYKMGIVTSPLCTFCGKSEESLEHLFSYCEFSQYLKFFYVRIKKWSILPAPGF